MSEVEVEITAYTPFEHQRAVHRAMKDSYRSGNIYVVKAKRQVGKSTMAENIVLEFAVNHPGTMNVIVEPTLNQSRRVYKEMLNALAESPLIQNKNDSLLEIKLVTGSTILFKSAEQRNSLRGFTVTGILVIDECAFILDEICDILLPTCDVHSAPILMISTPKFKAGFFYRYYTVGVEGSNPRIKSIDFNKFDTSFLLPPEKLEQYRQMMPKAQFTTEYLGEFVDTDAILFENISHCVGLPDDGWRNLYVGIDWGTGNSGDYTSVTGFNEHAQMVFCHYFNDKATYEQVNFITQQIIRPHMSEIRRIQAESNSIGTPMIDLLVDTLRKAGMGSIASLVKPFVTTNQEKVRLVSQLQVGFEQEQVRILDDPGLVSQLSAYEATYNPKTGTVSYNAPQGLHDDNCISTMLGYDAFMNSTRKGTYNITIT